jgi:hypothetical protein
MYGNFDFRGLVALAIFGAISAAVCTVGGVGLAIWFLIEHVRII